MAIIIKGEIGDIVITPSVIAKVAGYVANTCYGVVGMAAKNPKDDFVSLLNPENITKGIDISAEDNGIVITMHIIVEYGVNINAICDSIVHNVSYKVEKSTGIKVNKVQVVVESVRVQ